MDDDEKHRIEEIFAHGADVPLPDPRAPSDPVLTEMVRLSSLPPQSRNEALEPYLEKWLREEAGVTGIARYLAAAGLTLDQAAALEALVRGRMAEELRRQALNQVRMGMAAIGCGLLVLAGVNVAKLAFPLWGLVFSLAVAAGVGLLASGLRLLRRVTPATDE